MLPDGVIEGRPQDGVTHTAGAGDEAERPDSLTRGFLFADLRGYTEYVERHGGEAAAALLGRYRELVRDQVARFRGAEIRTEGDSFYVVFPSVSAAVRAGLGILDAATAANRDNPEHGIRVGVGVHAGETVETVEGYVGSAVNIAARLCALAGAGELLVSDTVRALTSTVVRARFVPRGRRQLKGIAEPMQVFLVSVTGSVPVARRRRVRVPPVVIGAAAVTAVALVAAVAAFALGDRLATPAASVPTSTVTHGAAAPTSATPAATASGPRLSVQEERLGERIPPDIAVACEAAPGAALETATAAFTCALPIGEGADSVAWHYFESRTLASLAFDRILRATNARQFPCDPDETAGPTRWEVGTTYSGRRVCYADETRATVAWLYETEQIVAVAQRTDGDFEELYAWWRFWHPLLRLQ